MTHAEIHHGLIRAWLTLEQRRDEQAALVVGYMITGQAEQAYWGVYCRLVKDAVSLEAVGAVRDLHAMGAWDTVAS